jgi:hypothetical protein
LNFIEATRVFPHVGANASELDEIISEWLVYAENEDSTTFEAGFHSKNCILANYFIFIYRKYNENQ